MGIRDDSVQAALASSNTQRQSPLIVGQTQTTSDGKELDNTKNSNISTWNEHSYVFPWEAMPYEIRDQMFAEVANDDCWYFGHYFAWNENHQPSYGSKPPPLLVALRPLKISYGHVLEWFAKYGSEVTVDRLANAELALLTKAKLDLSEWRYHFYARAQRAEDGRAKGVPKITLFTQQFVNAVNFREFHLSLDLQQTNQYEKLHFVTSWPFWLRGCKALKKVTVEIPRFRWGISERVQNRNINCLLRQAFKKTGVLGTCVEEIGSGISTADVYIWEATEGRFMDWSSKIGWKWEESRASRSDLGRRSAMEEINARLELREGLADPYFSLEGLDYWTYHGSIWD